MVHGVQPSMMMRVGNLITGLFVVFAVTMAASYLGAFWWGFELLSHLRVQLAVAAAIFAVFFLVRRAHVAAATAAILMLVSTMPLLPYLGIFAGAQAHPDGKNLRVMTVNLHRQQADLGALRRLIRSEKPDLVLITEFVTAPSRFLRDLDDILPNRAGSPRSGLFRVLLLSRLSIEAANIHKPSRDFLPVLEARLCAGSTDCFTLLGLHAARPGPSRSTGWRDAMLNFVAARAAASPDGRVVVIGDLNATPWSPVLRRVMKTGGLRDAAVGSPFRSTWTSRFPLLGLPLDQVLVGRGIGVQNRRVGESIGSDHYPVIADLTLLAGRPAQ